MKKIIFYIAQSKDGFIADKNGSVDWIPHGSADPAKVQESFKRINDETDTIIWGKVVYEQVMSWGIEWPYEQKSYVFSEEEIDESQGKRVSGDVNKFWDSIKEKSGKDVWLMGGANLAEQFTKEALIDEYRITTFRDVELKEGIKLFPTINPIKNKEAVKSYDLGGNVFEEIYLK